MKLVPMYYAFEFDKELDDAKEGFAQIVSSLRKREILHERLYKLDFPCEARFHVYTNSIDFYPPQGKWVNEEVLRSMLKILREEFNIRKFDKKFSETLGTYYWYSSDSDITISVHDAIAAPDCKVVSYQETVTKYKSVCGDSTDEQDAA